MGTCMSYFKMKRIFGPYFIVRAWACGAMDNASDYGSEDSRFESWQARTQVLNQWSPSPVSPLQTGCSPAEGEGVLPNHNHMLQCLSGSDNMPAMVENAGSLCQTLLKPDRKPVCLMCLLVLKCMKGVWCGLGA